MANQFLSLPVPTPTPPGSAAGASVDVSTLGAKKTFTVTIPPRYEGNLEVQFANDLAGTVWNSVKSFPNSRQITIDLVARWVRVLVTNYRFGDLPTVTLAAATATPIFVSVPATLVNGTAAPVDISTLGAVKTISVGGLYTGSAELEISNDGVTFNDVRGFADNAYETMEFTAQWARITRRGASQEYPGVVSVDMGCVDSGSGGGGAASNVTAFVYTATGTETADFAVLLPATRTAPYVVTMTTQGTTGNLVPVVDIPMADHTTTQFRVILSASLTAGDKLGFQVVDLVSGGV